MFATFDKLIERISRISAHAAAFLLVGWVFVFMTYIILRSFFHIPLKFVEEYTDYWIVVIVSLAIAYTLRKGMHIKVDILADLFPKKAGLIAEAVGLVIAIGTLVYFTWYSTEFLMHGIREGTRNMGGTESLLWPYYLLIPIGFVIFILEFFVLLGKAIIKCHNQK